MLYKKLLTLGVIMFIGCKAAKLQRDTHSECHVFTIGHSTDYEGNDKAIANIMTDFSSFSNNKNIDVVRINSISAYDYEERVKRMYTEDGKLYIINDSVIHTASNDDYNKFAAFFQNANTITKNIQCLNKSSSRYQYRYFLKVDKKIVINFSANQNFKDIDPALLGKEAIYIEYFENAK